MSKTPEELNELKNECEALTNKLERKVRTMEKINREELMKKLNLSDEDLEKVAGGYLDVECRNKCISLREEIVATCLAAYGEDDYRYKDCVIVAQNYENECQSRCWF